MKKPIFQGAATAIVTPMNTDGSVNFEKLKELTENQIISGIDAIVVCGTTGEGSTLTYEEHFECIKTVVEQTAKRVPVIAGAGSNDTSRAVLLGNNAVKAGADALLYVTPFYNKTSQTGLVAHYTHIADRVEAPVVLYNVPSRTGVNITPQTYYELSKHPNIVAAKEANGNISALAESLDLCGDELVFYSGNDDQTLPFLALGAQGVISVASNIIPSQMHTLCCDFFEGNLDKARATQLKLTQLFKVLFCDVNPVPVKTALNLLGYDAGPVRLPLVPLSEENTTLLKSVIEDTLY